MAGSPLKAEAQRCLKCKLDVFVVSFAYRKIVVVFFQGKIHLVVGDVEQAIFHTTSDVETSVEEVIDPSYRREIQPVESVG